MELKQIGPRIRKEVYDKFAEDCEKTRYSQSVIIEKLIKAFRMIKEIFIFNFDNRLLTIRIKC